MKKSSKVLNSNAIDFIDKLDSAEIKFEEYNAGSLVGGLNIIKYGQAVTIKKDEDLVYQRYSKNKVDHERVYTDYNIIYDYTFDHTSGLSDFTCITDKINLSTDKVELTFEDGSSRIYDVQSLWNAICFEYAIDESKAIGVTITDPGKNKKEYYYRDGDKLQEIMVPSLSEFADRVTHDMVSSYDDIVRLYCDKLYTAASDLDYIANYYISMYPKFKKAKSIINSLNNIMGYYNHVLDLRKITKAKESKYKICTLFKKPNK